MMNNRIFLVFIISFYTSVVYGQEAEKVTKTKSSKTTKLLISGAVIYTGTMIGLNELWYKQYPRSKLHSFNDNLEWLQMDKTGHLVTSYFVGYVGHESFVSMGMSDKISRYVGGCVGLVFQTGVEILDGKSAQWGFSWGDQLTNIAGAGIFILEDHLWDEQRIKLKYSFMRSPYARYHPSLLGENVYQEVLKDYNGQTHWASFNIASVLQLKQESRFPDWLNVAFGYGVDGLLGGYDNDDFPGISFERKRQYYLSLDIDLSRIESNSDLLNALKKAFGFIKIPSPTLEFNQGGGMNYYWMYF